MKTRGAIPVIVLWVVGLFGASQVFVPNFRITNWFKKGPPTKELAADDALALLAMPAGNVF